MQENSKTYVHGIMKMTIFGNHVDHLIMFLKGIYQKNA